MSDGEDLRRVTLDAKRLRALAHPLRVRLLSALRLDGPATATGLGRRFGQNSANASWHLRQLAEVGLVAEDRRRGNRRERWWIAAQDRTEFDPGDLSEDPDASDSLVTYLSVVNGVHHEQSSTYLATMQDWSREWRSAAELTDDRLPLTAQEASELNRRIQSVVEEFRRAPQAEDVEVFTHWHAFPVREHPDTGDQL
ncbi:DNA-binding transcriptional ArsR family regulator [Saccharopolyspora lacisalsi]|uniref:DNA-binding transcriptional ArsR family regulator n=1 Tax=Halosaccharopolyspora lacisalsi TaxID=1000566 RepID=A0A839DT22_9PSEU|nr:helix-turn-helix domain-containing protein [Halosaccharopolyspora lacisalsi]MBA8823899.1 DNA-binding transcriptional ArsR family regulator [Halosaccharopolyspora lacisalsi]